MNDHQENSNGALDGVRIVDLSRVLAGPLSTQMLADHGAEVIKVEPPAGDETRGWGPPFHGEDASYFTALNRNKRDITVDLSRPEGCEILFRLLEDADVLVENFKPGTLEKWGIGFDAVLSTRFPRLIHCRVASYGDEGPLAGFPGYDGMVQAWAGLMDLNGLAGSGPMRLGIPVVDIVTAHNAAIGVLLALNERATSGRGQSIEVALYDVGLSMLLAYAASWFDTGQPAKRTGNNNPLTAPYGVFKTKTVSISLAANNNRAFEKLCVALGMPELVGRPEFASNKARLENQDELNRRIGERTQVYDGLELAQHLMRSGLPAGAVMSVGEALSHPQTTARGRVAQIGKYRGVAPPVRLSRTPPSVRRAPPKYSEHSHAILTELGYSAAEIDGLVNSGVAPAKRNPAG